VSQRYHYVLWSNLQEIFFKILLRISEPPFFLLQREFQFKITTQLHIFLYIFAELPPLNFTPPPQVSLYFCVCREELASRVRLTDNAALKLQLRLNHRDQNILNILNEPREYNGMCNNLNHPHGGATLSTMRRLLPPDYADGNSNYPKEICKLIQPLISKRKSQTKSNQNKQMARH
jgi:hypothetical protein